MSDFPNSESPHSTKAQLELAERRSSERFPFSAVTEIVDLATSARITARASDISLSGCYIDLLNVLPPGTRMIKMCKEL